MNFTQSSLLIEYHNASIGINNLDVFHKDRYKILNNFFFQNIYCFVFLFIMFA
jgi:hypothetical protein